MIPRARLVWLLPIAIAVHAVFFWGARGFIDKEGVVFVSNYLAERGPGERIFDPLRNDFGTYQARELSYAFDSLNAHALAWAYSLGWFVLTPLTGVLGLAAAMLWYGRGARRWPGLDRTTIALLLSWFLSTIVVQSSVAIFYRSAKILLLVFLIGFLFHVCRLLGQRTAVTRWTLAGLFVVAVTMGLADRQGFFFLAWFAGVAAIWYVLSPAAVRPGAGVVLPVALTIAAAVGAVEVYNIALAPALIQFLNGYRPDFAYQHLEIGAHIGTAEFWRQGWQMMLRQAAFSTGGVAVAAIAAAGFVTIAWLRSPSRRVAVRDVLTGIAGFAGLVLLASLMILRHPYVAIIPDHAYWYNFLPVHGVFLFGATAWLAGLSLPDGWRRGVWVALGLFIVLNVAQIRSHRHAMLASPYIASEYEKTREMIDGVARMRAGDEEPANVGRWMSVGPAGGVVRLPGGRSQFFPDTLDAILATRARRPPFDRPLGTLWLALRDFYVQDGSPLNEPDQIPDVLEAWGHAGIREVRLDLSAFADRAAGERLHAAIHAQTARVEREEHRGAVTRFFLRAPEPLRGRDDSIENRRLPPAALAITTSPPDQPVAPLTDGDMTTRWSTGRPQRGDEWIRVAFDRPRNVARVILELERRSYGDYPRGVSIESVHDGGTTVLFAGSALPPYALGLLDGPLRTARAEICLPSNRSDAILIRQTGGSPGFHWAVHELAVWER